MKRTVDAIKADIYTETGRLYEGHKELATLLDELSEAASQGGYSAGFDAHRQRRSTVPSADYASEPGSEGRVTVSGPEHPSWQAYSAAMAQALRETDLDRYRRLAAARTAMARDQADKRRRRALQTLGRN